MESAAARSFFPTDRRVVYCSRQDRCWIAHSTLTDQIGTGETIIEAMVDLLRTLEQLLELARQDPSIQIYRRAPGQRAGPSHGGHSYSGADRFPCRGEVPRLYGPRIQD